MVPERENVCNALRSAGVVGVDDFGRFVNNTKYFAASQFDDVAATPVLLGLLPDLTDPVVVATVARHIQHGRIRPNGFDVLLVAFRRWGADDSLETGWVLGEALTRAADATKGQVMVELCTDRRYGRSRQMIVYALWRWRKTAPVEVALRALIEDPQVSLQAMSALERTVGQADALPLLEDLATRADDDTVRRQAKQRLARTRKKLMK